MNKPNNYEATLKRSKGKYKGDEDKQPPINEHPEKEINYYKPIYTHIPGPSFEELLKEQYKEDLKNYLEESHN